MTINRRELLGYSAAALGAAAVGLPQIAKAAAGELTIAYN
ncbi:MAG: twin-arginine translocation signal domain-containing protein, partial [Mesorhizobium sp.]